MIYFDACATGGKKADCVIDACRAHFDSIANSGRSGHKLAIQNGAMVWDFRCLIADSFQIENPARVIITKNCSEALNLGIFGVLGGIENRGNFKPHVIATALDHNSVLRPLFHLKSKGDIALTILYPNKSQAITASQISAALRKNTRLVCMNLVSNVTGGQSEVEKTADILKNTDIPLLCDGAQGLGHLDFSAKNVDILCAPMHKALGGVVGVGFCAFSTKCNTVPIAFGGTGTNSLSLLQGSDFPESFETGTLNTLGIAASKAGLSHKISQLKQSQKKVADLTAHLESFKFSNLKKYSVENECGIFSFLIDGFDSAQLANILDEKYDIACRGGLTCAPLCHKFLGTTKSGVLRISFDEYNTHQEIEILAKAIFEISK